MFYSPLKVFIWSKEAFFLFRLAFKSPAAADSFNAARRSFKPVGVRHAGDVLVIKQHHHELGVSPYRRRNASPGSSGIIINITVNGFGISTIYHQEVAWTDVRFNL